MAEFIFKRLVEESGESRNFEIASRATSNEEIGNPVYPPARRELSRHGISCEGKYATALLRSDYGKYDLIIGMDSANMRNMNRIFGGDPDCKIKKLMDYTERGGDVCDPWYFGNFEGVFRDIYEGCEALFEQLCKK